MESMGSIIESALAAAAKSKIRLAVMIADENSNNGAEQQVPADIQTASKVLGDEVEALKLAKNSALNQNQVLCKQIEALKSELAEAKNEALAAVAASRGDDAESTQKISVLVAESAEKGKRIEELERTESALREKLAAQVAQPTDGASFEDHDIEMLGLDEDLAKTLRSKGWNTVGKLRDALLDGSVKKAKVTNKTILSIAFKLLSDPIGIVGRSSGKSDSSPRPASDVPDGHNDISWTERLDACLRKRAVVKQAESHIAALEKKIPTIQDEAEKAKVTSELEMMRMHHGQHQAQQIAMIYCLGLDPTTKDAEKSLKEAGLEHLIDEHKARALQQQLVQQ